jgi:catechol 2,3-dioxygenase
MASTIDAATTIGAVALSVADLRRSLDYYQHDIGLALLSRRGDQATLGVGSTTLLRLQEIPGARLVRRATGLYHFALRVPTRRDLAGVLRHFAERGTQLGGAADHLFSEALYLSDPDGHGIEIYRDRPRDSWYDVQGSLRVASDPLDLRSIVRELDGDESRWDGLPAGTDMGHIHLQVASIRDAERFYIDVLGFERMIGMPTASFVSAGGYHHHIGMNTWAGVGVSSPPEGAARLLGYEVVLPRQNALRAVIDRVRAAGASLAEDAQGWVTRDPSDNRILLRSSA